MALHRSQQRISKVAGKCAPTTAEESDSKKFWASLVFAGFVKVFTQSHGGRLRRTPRQREEVMAF